MVRKLLPVRLGLLSAAFILLAAGLLLWVTSAATNINSAKSPVQWDEKASREVAAALHRMHEVANSGDIEGLKKLMVGDDVLVTFELASDNHTPIPLRSKKDIDVFIDDIVEEADSQNGTFALEMPRMKCRATSTFGVCTEECTVRLKMPDGVEKVDKLFGTAVAVKYADGWKWIQWHMSVGAPSQMYKDGELVASGIRQ